MTDLIPKMPSRSHIVMCFYSIILITFSFDGIILSVASPPFLILALSQSRPSSPYLIPHSIQLLSQMSPNPFCLESNFLFVSSFIVNFPKQ